MSKVHSLKTESQYFNAILDGWKSFELRKNDRHFKVGDYLQLLETLNGDYTGRELNPRKVVYILHGGQYGLLEGFVILQMKSIDGHFEMIECPNCGEKQLAVVEHLHPFNSYVHFCECGYTITESEWNQVPSKP